MLENTENYENKLLELKREVASLKVENKLMRAQMKQHEIKMLDNFIDIAISKCGDQARPYVQTLLLNAKQEFKRRSMEL